MGCPLKEMRALIDTFLPSTSARPGIMESADDKRTCVPRAELVSRLAASGGPCAPGSRANTNKGVSPVRRGLRPGAMLRFTVAEAFAEALAGLLGCAAAPAPAGLAAAAVPLASAALDADDARSAVPSSAIR